MLNDSQIEVELRKKKMAGGVRIAGDTSLGRPLS